MACVGLIIAQKSEGTAKRRSKVTIASNVIRELLENGVHFGHQTNKWNPKMKKYIFGAKSGIYIINLEKTEEALMKAAEFLAELTASGKTVLFAGTKKQAKKIIREEAQRCGMFFIDERWLGGCLTNFQTVRRSVDKLDQIQEMKEGDVYTTLAKKEKARIDRVEHKLLKNLEGIREMKKLPDCIVVVDAEAEEIAVKEGRKIGIPVIALIDTNCDPDMIDYPIPGNDDSIRSIQYVIRTLADAAEKGRKQFSGEAAVKPAGKEEEKGLEEVPAEPAVDEAASVKEGSKDEAKEEEPSGSEAEAEETKVFEPAPVVVVEKVKDDKEEKEKPEEDIPSDIGEVAEGDIELDS